MRNSRRFKRLVIGIGVFVGIALVVNGILAWSAQHRLDQRIAELRAAGEPTSLAELAQRPIPPVDNAATYLDPIAAQLQTFSEELAKFYDSPLGKKLDNGTSQELLPDPEQRAAVQKILDAYPEFMPAIEKAAACNGYVSPRIDYKGSPSRFLMDEVELPGALRMIAIYSNYKMKVLVAKGNSDDAIRLAIRILRIARLYDQEPVFVTHLASLSTRGLMYDAINRAVRYNTVAPAVRAELEAELASVETLGTPPAFLGERAWFISFLIEQTSPIFLHWPKMNWWLRQLDSENQACDLAKLPLAQIRREWDTAKRRTVWPQLPQISGAIGSAAVTVIGSDSHCLTLSRCLRVLNALGEYGARTGNEADDIDQLPLPHEATIDPGTGKRLRIKKTGAGWVVYAVYRDDDDSGTFHPEDGAFWGFGPPGYSSQKPK